MFEIELKAHVYDRASLVEKLKTFAEYTQTVTRNDVYYHVPILSKNNKEFLSVRLRKETKNTTEGVKETNIITYKRKERKISDTGIESELNDEKECEATSLEVLETLFFDAGFEPYLKKQKSVEDYTVQTPYGKATLELCAVSQLGDFLEIEILSAVNDEKTVCQIQEELKNLLEKCGIPEKDIENRYYSELLAEINKKD